MNLQSTLFYRKTIFVNVKCKCYKLNCIKTLLLEFKKPAINFMKTLLQIINSLELYLKNAFSIIRIP